MASLGCKNRRLARHTHEKIFFVTDALALRPELDRLRCSEPGCECDDKLVLFGLCHDAPVWATYSKGELELRCAECDAHVLTIAVAG